MYTAKLPKKIVFLCKCVSELQPISPGLRIYQTSFLIIICRMSSELLFSAYLYSMLPKKNLNLLHNLKLLTSVRGSWVTVGVLSSMHSSFWTAGFCWRKPQQCQLWPSVTDTEYIVFTRASPLWPKGTFLSMLFEPRHPLLASPQCHLNPYHKCLQQTLFFLCSATNLHNISFPLYAGYAFSSFPFALMSTSTIHIDSLWWPAL